MMTSGSITHNPAALSGSFDDDIGEDIEFSPAGPGKSGGFPTVPVAAAAPLAGSSSRLGGLARGGALAGRRAAGGSSSALGAGHHDDDF